MISKKQLVGLFICGFIPRAVASGIVPLMPVHARQLGADAAGAGVYLAIGYLSTAVGSLLSGWISDHLQHRKLPLIITGLGTIPAAWLIGRSGDYWNLNLYTAILVFFGGLGLGFIGILAGLSAGESERGRVFGILSLASGIASPIGALLAGYIVDHWGFSAMFSTFAGFLVLWPLSGLFLTEQVVEKVETQTTRKSAGFGRHYYLALSAGLTATVAGFIILLGRSLMMNDLAFSALAISSTEAVSGVVAMPLPLILGWLSDRTNRKHYLYLAYVAGLAGLAIAAVSTSLWHFMVILILQTILAGVNVTVGKALVTDLLPRERLGRGLALFSAVGWIAGFLGYAGGGYAFQHLGTQFTFLIGLCLPLVAIVLLLPVKAKDPRQICFPIRTE